MSLNQVGRFKVLTLNLPIKKELKRLWARSIILGGEHLNRNINDQTVDLCYFAKMLGGNRFISTYIAYFRSYGYLPNRCPVAANQTFYIKNYPGANGRAKYLSLPPHFVEAARAFLPKVFLSSKNNSFKFRYILSVADNLDMKKPLITIKVIGIVFI